MTARVFGRLSVRLLIAMLAVAAFGVALASWLVSSQTAKAIEDKSAQTADATDRIIARFDEQITEADSLEGLGSLAQELAGVHDTRITLISDGRLLADTASESGRNLPSARTVLDAWESAFFTLYEQCLSERLVGYQGFGAQPPTTNPNPSQDAGTQAQNDADRQAIEELCDDEATNAADELNSDLPAVTVYVGSAKAQLTTFDRLGLGRLIFLSAIVLSAAAAAAGVVASRITRPLHELAAGANQLAAGDLRRRVSETGPAEVAQLGQDFNTLAEELERSDKARKAMVADLAHELRNPLGGMQGSLEAAQDGVFPIDRALIDNLHGETLLLSELVADLAQLADADAGSMQLSLQAVDLAQLAERACTPLAAALTEAGVSLHTDLQATPTQADERRFRQIVTNLITNAVAACEPDDNITVTTRPSPTGCELRVSDTGSGMSSDEVKSAFQRFWRADVSRNRRHGGSGLGLAICRGLVTAHKGAIEIESEPGRGTTVTVTLPLRGSEPLVATPRSSHSAQQPT